jgi:hypothetical protein
MAEEIITDDWPDTVPDDLASQDEVAPESEADQVKPTSPRPRWQDKIRGKQEPRRPKAIPPKPRSGALVKPFTDLYTTVGTMLMPFDQQCGMVIIQNAEECAKALDSAARENPAMRRVLLAMVQTSVWGQLIAAHLPILMAVAMHHVGPLKAAMSQAPVMMMPPPQPDPSQNGQGHYGG